MHIEYFKKNNYGRYVLYVDTPEAKEPIAILTGGKKTIDQRDIEALEALGHEMVEIINPDVLPASTPNAQADSVGENKEEIL